MSSDRSKSKKHPLSVGISAVILVIILTVMSLAFLAVNQRHGSDFSYTITGAVNLNNWTETKGTPVTIKSGYAVLEQYYDEANKQIGEAYFGADGQGVELTDGRHEITIGYHEDGTSTRNYLDLEGNVIKTEEK